MLKRSLVYIHSILARKIKIIFKEEIKALKTDKHNSTPMSK